VPLNPFQAKLARLLAINRSPDSYLAGGAALHFKPNTLRYSQDLDYFHDSVERVASAFASDEQLLHKHGFTLEIEIKQPGYIRAQVTKNREATKIEWAHDSAWRFMPAIANEESGYQLHPIDLALNKVLALVGRDEPRDYLDVLYVHEEILPLGALCWAAAGKDPGFTPLSLLELLKRRGKYRAEDFDRLMLTKKINLKELKSTWLAALEAAETFISERPPSEMGCLYYSPSKKIFIAPKKTQTRPSAKTYALHFGRPGGVLPQFLAV
jgi:hypothetical protein